MAATPALSVAWVVPDIAAGLVTFGLAAWLWRLTLDEALLFDRVAVRTLSVFLVAHGGAIAFTGLAYTPEAERLADWAIRVGPYFAFAAPLTALAFTVTALTRRGSRAPRAAAWVCGAGALAIWAAYVADPAGPWVVLGGATMVLSLALSAFAFALAASREPDPGRRTGWLLIHFGLLVFSLWHSGWDGVAHLEHLAHGGFAAGAEVILLATPLVAAASIPIALRAP
ncbi:MAG TPA: hypothetical protein VI997_03500, partial [Candidatus Thermoplasmatota archaeon]|nr:hypothetical protein [Candidatus Thermoplasmatota archaeon]